MTRKILTKKLWPEGSEKDFIPLLVFGSPKNYTDEELQILWVLSEIERLLTQCLPKDRATSIKKQFGNWEIGMDSLYSKKQSLREAMFEIIAYNYFNSLDVLPDEPNSGSLGDRSDLSSFEFSSLLVKNLS